MIMLVNVVGVVKAMAGVLEDDWIAGYWYTDSGTEWGTLCAW